MKHSETLPLVVLISGSGTNLQAIIDACSQQTINAKIRAVISNRPNVRGLERAQSAGIPAIVLDHQAFPDRSSYEQQLRLLIDAFDPGLVVLAGYMRILEPETVSHYHGRMLNIHPSLLPAHPGLHTHKKALDSGDAEHGASVHFVTPELDGGPVVLQVRIPVLNKDDEATLSARVLQQEHQLYPQAIDLFANGRLVLKDQKATLDGDVLDLPIQMTADSSL